MRKSELRSTSCSAMGVPASPGRSEMAAEVPVEPAMRVVTVSSLLSSASMVFW